MVKVSRRMERVNQLLREEVAKHLQQYYSHEALGFLTVIGARVTPDLKNATIFISVMGEKTQQESACRALNDAAYGIRRAIRRFLSFKTIPMMTFELDHTAEEAERINVLLRDTEKKADS